MEVLGFGSDVAVGGLGGREVSFREVGGGGVKGFVLMGFVGVFLVKAFYFLKKVAKSQRGIPISPFGYPLKRPIGALPRLD